MSTLFSLNVNKIALLRNSRGTNYPNLEFYVEKAIDLGVKSITVHPRQDERHIKYRDLQNIKNIIKNRPGIELNIEGYPNEMFITNILAVEPDQVTLVPDAQNQLTSDHGWNIEDQKDILISVIPKLKESNARICLFWDPVEEGLDSLKSMGVDGIELYTEPYVKSFHEQDFVMLEQYGAVFDKAKALGLRVNAGHDLNTENLATFLGRCPVDEVSIGHAFMVEAFDHGCEFMIQNYQEICSYGNKLSPVVDQ